MMPPSDKHEEKDEMAASTAGQQNGELPSGFILKLYQMVNGAPDEVISVRFLCFSVGRPRRSLCSVE